MKKRLNYLLIISIGIIMYLVLPANLLAQTEPLGPLMAVTEFTIKPGHEMQFREGVKTWKACYLENKGEWTWRMWRRHQGEGIVFVLASDMVNWAEMDETDESGKNCQELARSLINPHVEKAVRHITRFQPGISKSTPLAEGEEIIRVTFFKLNYTSGYRMLEVVKEVEKIRTNAKIDIPVYWYQWQTSGPESPDYHVVMPYKNYASMDIIQEGVWDMVEKNVGKAKRDELQTAFRSSLANTWNYIYKLEKDISRPTQ